MGVNPFKFWAEQADGAECGTGSGSEEAKRKSGTCQAKVLESSVAWSPGYQVVYNQLPESQLLGGL